MNFFANILNSKFIYIFEERMTSTNQIEAFKCEEQV